MIKKLHIAVVLLCFSYNCFSQEASKASEIIEGGKVLLEFTKLFVNKDKSKNAQTPCQLKQCSDAAFENKGTNIIRVRLLMKDTGEAKAELVIQPGKKESVFEIKVGLYTYEFYDQATNALVRKGDIRFTACENLYIGIQ